MLDIDLGVNLEDLTFLDSQQDKRGLYKCVVNKDQFPNNKIKTYPLEKGDAIFLSGAGMGEIYSVGHKIKKFDTEGIVSKVYKEPKKWWQFWKKTKILGYKIEFI